MAQLGRANEGCRGWGGSSRAVTQCRDRRSSARSRWVPSRRRPLSRHPQAEMRLLGGPRSLQPSLRGGGQLPARPWCPPDALLVSWGCPVAVPWSRGTSGTRLLGSPSPASRQCWGRGCPAAAAPLFPQKFDRAGVPRLDTAEMSLLNPSGSTCPAALGCWGSRRALGAHWELSARGFARH